MTALIALLPFVIAAALLTITPGLDTVLVIRTFLTAGRRSAFRAALGIEAGCFVWGLGVAVGLGAVLAAAPLVYTVIRWAGALYLIGCGVLMLARPRSALAPTSEAGPETVGDAFRRGLLTNLLNPKVGLFYLSFLPQFVPAGWPPAPTMIGLTTIHIVLALVWFAMLIGSAAGLRRAVTTRAGLVRGLDRLTGLVFVGFGLRLAFDRR